ncbi:hypothetical protein Bca4012_065493 [Brassica carinata]
MLMSVVPITTWTNARHTVFPCNSGPVTVHKKRSCSQRRAPIISKHLTNTISIFSV